MSKKNPPPIQAGTADVGTAILSGDAYFRISQEFISPAARNFNTAHIHATENFGELIASATNIALAIEIYLKALLLHSGHSAPKTHELPELFAKLPPAVRAQVEQTYERLRGTEEEGTNSAFAVHVAPRHASPPSFGDAPKRQDNTLQAVLQRSANAFVTWRYLFSHNLTASGAPLVYEFLRLGFVAQALRAQFGTLAFRVGGPSAP